MRDLSVLVVDDERVQRQTLASILQDEGCVVFTAMDVASAIDVLSHESIELVLSDFRLPGGSGLDVAKAAHELCPEAQSMIMTAYADVESIIEAMRLGVLDYILKPINVDALLRRLSIIKERRHLQLEVNFLKSEIARQHDDRGMLGSSPSMEEIRRIIEQVSQSRGTVLITGESGTGKEVVARTIHQMSPTRSGKFVAVNCGALPENLLESELFGHKKGSFTGAIADKVGLFALANEGTLFLDEIGEMPKSLQVKLLRALQEREFTPVGDTKTIKVNLRVIAATNRDLGFEVEQNNFRQDLYYRLNVVEIKMPPLRERRVDIPLLARFFIDKYTKELGKPPRVLSNDASRLLVTYSWPGNVRELENVIERAIILSQTPDRIEAGDLAISSSQQRPGATKHAAPINLDDAVKFFTKQHIHDVLQSFDHDKKEAAKALGMGLSSLYRKLEELDIGLKKGG